MPMHDWTRVDPNNYHHFHGRWVYALADVLNAGGLPPGYYALAEHTTPPLVPDVLTLEIPTAPGGEPDPAGGGTAVATAPPRARCLATGPLRPLGHARQRRLAVRHVRGRRLVAVIELVSPSIKADRQAFAGFVGKIALLLRQGIHFLVIDPFPPGGRDPDGLHAAIWRSLTRRRVGRPAGGPATLAAYAAGEQVSAFVEQVRVSESLPDMPLFLAPGAHVPVPLEPTYRTAWATFPGPLRAVLEAPAAG